MTTKKERDELSVRDLFYEKLIIADYLEEIEKQENQPEAEGEVLEPTHDEGGLSTEQVTRLSIDLIEDMPTQDNDPTASH